MTPDILLQIFLQQLAKEVMASSGVFFVMSRCNEKERQSLRARKNTYVYHTWTSIHVYVCGAVQCICYICTLEKGTRLKKRHAWKRDTLTQQTRLRRRHALERDTLRKGTRLDEDSSVPRACVSLVHACPFAGKKIKNWLSEGIAHFGDSCWERDASRGILSDFSHYNKHTQTPTQHTNTQHTNTHTHSNTHTRSCTYTRRQTFRFACFIVRMCADTQYRIDAHTYTSVDTNNIWTFIHLQMFICLSTQLHHNATHCNTLQRLYRRHFKKTGESKCVDVHTWHSTTIICTNLCAERVQFRSRTCSCCHCSCLASD